MINDPSLVLGLEGARHRTWVALKRIGILGGARSPHDLDLETRQQLDATRRTAASATPYRVQKMGSCISAIKGSA
jgi:hypothetical protein